LDSLPIFEGKFYLKLSQLILNWTVQKLKNNSYADNTGLTDRYIISMQNAVGEQGLALQQLFPYKSSYKSSYLRNIDCHKISFNDEGLKLGVGVFSISGIS